MEFVVNLEFFLGAHTVTGASVSLRQSVVRVRIIRFELHGRLKLRDGFRIVMLVVKNDPELKMRVCRPRV
jgi:hypothetical protein